jgi:uncharacterized protein (DUF983 family)
VRPNPTFVDHLRSLDLGVDATGDDVRAAFRRLVRQHHPDLNRTAASDKRFIEVVEAYRALQTEMGLRPNLAHYRLCPRCGHYGELLDGLDGRPGCVDCLLGIMGRRRYLPLPVFVTVRHVGTIALIAASVLFALLYAQDGPLRWAALSLGCAGLGVLLLYIACMTVPTVVSGERRQMRAPRREARSASPCGPRQKGGFREGSLPVPSNTNR